MTPVFFIRHLQKEFKDTFLEHVDKNKRTMVVGFGYDMQGQWYNSYEEYEEDKSISQKLQNNKGFKKAHKKFKSLIESEYAIVWSIFDNKEFFIAEYKKKKNPFKKYKVRTSDGYGSDKIAGLTLSNAEIYSFHDYPVLLGTKPTQGTICNPNANTSAIIKAIFKKEKFEPSIRLLHFNTTEQLCENFLRDSILVERYIKESNLIQISPDELIVDFCLTNVGKSLPHVDISAINKKGNRLYAQVTHSEGNIKKRDTFIDWFENSNTPTIGILFTPDPEGIIKDDKNIKVLNLNIANIYNFILNLKPKMILALHDKL